MSEFESTIPGENDEKINRLVAAFSEMFSEDVDAGGPRGLMEYLELFPGAAEAVAAEYFELKRRLAEPDDLRPAHLERYEIRRQLGHGGQGTVWLAYDRTLGREVALKLLEGAGRPAQDAIQRFRREAEAASRLDHPGICTVLDAGIENGVPFIAMQLVKGVPLSTWISELGNERGARTTLAENTSGARRRASREIETSVRESVTIIEKAARALHRAHEAGIVHRDVKPGNIMLDDTGQPILLDFGLARLEEASVVLTRTGEFFGSPAYMSPEQFSGAMQSLDRKTDVYSLGVTLYECLTRRLPFQAPTAAALRLLVLDREPPSPRHLNPAVSRDLSVVTLTAMEKEPARRYQTAEQLAEELRRVLEHRPILARPVSTFGRARRWAKRHPARAALLVVLLVAVPALTAMGGYIVAVQDDVDQQQRMDRLARADRLAEEGFYQLERGDLRLAENALRDSLTENEGATTVLGGLILCLCRQERRHEAHLLLDAHRSRFAEAGSLMAVVAAMDLANSQPTDAPEVPRTQGHFLAGLFHNEQARASVAPAERKKSYRRARHHFWQAILYAPRAQRAHYYSLASAVQRTREPQLAREVARAIGALWPTDPRADTHIALATECFDLPRAIEIHTRLIERSPEEPTLRTQRAEALLRLGRTQEALADAEAALRLDDDEPRYRFFVGYVLRIIGRLEEALAHLEKMTALSPNSFMGHMKTGEVLFHLRRFDEAAAAYGRAHDAAPGFGHSLCDWAEALRAAGRPEDALRVLKKGLEREPTSERAHELTCVVLDGLDRMEEIRAFAAEFARRFPDNAPARWHHANGLIVAGLREEAIAEYRECLRLDPKLDKGYVGLLAYLGDDALEEAAALGRRGLENIPDHVGIAGYLAETLTKLERFDEAFEVLFNRLPEAPGRARVWTQAASMAVAWYRRGAPEIARKLQLVICQEARRRTLRGLDPDAMERRLKRFSRDQ